MPIALDAEVKSDVVRMSIGPVAERRKCRRHDLEQRELSVQRWDAARQTGTSIGQIVDLSASGMKFKTRSAAFRTDSHIKVRLDLPAYAGIAPFFGAEDQSGRTDWAGWLVVTRVQKSFDGGYEVAGRLMDMDEMNRGMLGLYLSTQPLAA